MPRLLALAFLTALSPLLPAAEIPQNANVAKVTGEKKKKSPKSTYDKANDPFSQSGNIVPTITKLTPEQEAAILADVKVPDGFEATLFANSAAANYPVFVAATPDGTLYVSSDGNGSLGRDPKRGRIIRLRDLDGDGHADEAKVFCEVDSPRGLVWDHDRLFVVHPPNLSEFIDADGDGVAEKEKILVKDIAFGFKDRPADHTTNGLSLGIDGWLYIAGGDFGFMKATGTDGKTLQHRGGGVIRVRPDGTDLQVYSTGTRNILEVAISPVMDIFARDNTNDGGGWDVRFHHFTGLENHGYPRLYMNFKDECIQPLADYGGGSGCGAVYIDEPGFGKWNNSPFTCDWGTGALWHHQVKPKGATFEETSKPEPFIKMTRPTDADVDGNSRVYCSSWKGATFKWEGPDVGYIVQVKPKGFKAEPMPNFTKASDAALIKLLESPSNRRRMEAQREIMRRDGDSAHGGNSSALLTLAQDKSKPAAVRSTALLGAYTTLSTGATRTWRMSATQLCKDLQIGYIAAAALQKEGLPWSQLENVATMATSPSPRNRIAAMHLALYGQRIHGLFSERQSAKEVGYGLDEKGLKEQSPKMAKALLPLLKDSDPVVSHTAISALRNIAEAGPCFEALDSGNVAMLPVLRGIHSPVVVAGLIGRLGKATDPALRQGILAALCRLHFQEGPWKGDSWGTRPDTRGPYYQPEEWSETPKIAAVLKEVLAKASPEEASFLVKEMNRNRINNDNARQQILDLAKRDPQFIPEAVAQLASADSVPAEVVPLLLQALKMPDAKTATLSQAIIALAKTDSAEGACASLAALKPLKDRPMAKKEYETAATVFFNSPKLENHHQIIEEIAAKHDGDTAITADAALLYLAVRKSGSPESIQLSQKALDEGWKDAARRKQIVLAIGFAAHQASAAKVLSALDDSDPAVQKAAQETAKAMRITKVEDKTPKIATLNSEEVLAVVLKEKGDVSLGQQVFTRATCVACHTVSESEAQKGPYLGNIAQTYRRPDLGQNILDPNKTIAQGFATELVVMKDGTTQMGFITLEGPTEIKMRNIASQEFVFKTADIKERQKLPTSMMPPGLMNNFTVKEFASLLDYLESLVKK